MPISKPFWSPQPQDVNSGHPRVWQIRITNRVSKRSRAEFNDSVNLHVRIIVNRGRKVESLPDYAEKTQRACCKDCCDNVPHTVCKGLAVFVEAIVPKSYSISLNFLLLIACALLATQPAFSNSLKESLEETVEVPRMELQAIRDELQYLRQRDAQREATDEAIIQQLANEGSWVTSQCSWGKQVHCDSITCGSELGSGCCDTCCGAGNCCCGSKCCCSGACSSCLCPTPTAPCIDCPHVSTLNPYFNVSVFGTLTADLLFNEGRPITSGTPYFMTPGPLPGRKVNTFDLHARQSTLGAVLSGPQLGDWQTGGQVLAVFYNDNVLADKYGVLPMLAFGEMRNADWRFAAGLQFDVFNPLLPTILPFSALSASGNSGNAFRGQVRLERFINPSDAVQWTLQTALSAPLPTTIDPTFGLSEDNGWPNVEARIAVALGAPQGAGAAALRPFELGFSGVVGQIRTTPLPPDPQVVADVWGVGTDLRWRVNDLFGVAAEFHSGQGLGTYNGAVLQTINRDTLQAIRSSGGWCELYAYLTPCLHSHWGCGIDDPNDGDVDADPLALGRTRNETYFANLLWDLNKSLRLGFEFTWRETEYLVLDNNDGAGYHTQFRWSF